MKYDKILLFLAVVSGITVSCSKEGSVTETDSSSISGKIIRINDNVMPGEFNLQFVQVPTEEVLRDMEKTHSIKLEKVFPATPGNEALEKEFGLDRWYTILLDDETDLDQMVYTAASRLDVARVEYSPIAEKNYDGNIYPFIPETRGTAGNFNDPYLSYQWHYENLGSPSVSPTAFKGGDINVKDVWKNLTCGDPSIIVAVIDEGVKYSHPDLKDNMWVNSKEIPDNGIDDDGNGYIDDVYGFNFVTNNSQITWNNPEDSGHGTHCAGTIAAVNNNSLGVAGVAGGSGNKDGCRIMTCQIFSGRQGASARRIAQAIKYAADNGASIISCSFGSEIAYSSDNAFLRAGGDLELDAIHYFEAKKNNPVLNGNIAIFAASNDAKNYAYYPGAFYDIISVSALGPDFLPTYYTNYGPGCNICAPGGEAFHIVNKWNSMVLSTVPSEVKSDGINGEYSVSGLDYGYMQGTSMACPHVSGVVALGLSYAKKLGKTFDRDEFKRMILASVNDIDQRISSHNSKEYAYGRGPLSLSQYYHQMGTGAIDTWRLMMKIEGTPTSLVQVGKSQWVDLTSTFGTASVSLTYLKVNVPQTTVDALGLQKIKGTANKNYPAVPAEDSYAFIQFGRLYIHPTKIGSGIIGITAIGGGSHVGGGDNPPGGMELEQDISIIARENGGGNGTGGWL